MQQQQQQPYHQQQEQQQFEGRYEESLDTTEDFPESKKDDDY